MKNIMILGKGLTDVLDDITLTTEKEYYISFIKQQNKFCLSLNYNESNSQVFVNVVSKVTNSKQKISK